MAEISLNLPDDLATRISDLARRLGASREELILRSLPSGLDNADALDLWLAEGEADVAAGRVVPFEDAMDRVDTIVARARARHAERS